MAHPRSNGHCIDLELAFINSLAEKMNAKALRGYCEGCASACWASMGGR